MRIVGSLIILMLGIVPPVAQAAQTHAAADTARINLVYTRLLSPIAGRIGRSSVTEGALVTSDQAQSLATVQQLDPMYVDVTQPSTVLLRLKRELAAGELEQSGDNQAQVHLVLEDGSAYQLPGRMQFAEVSVDETTGSVTLRADVRRRSSRLRASRSPRIRWDASRTWA